MRAPISVVLPGHPDHVPLSKIRDAVVQAVGGQAELDKLFPVLVREAIDFVLDPVRTARTRLGDLDNVEKTFIGLKVEHFVRDMLDVPKGLRDLIIDGIDVDVKNTTRGTWMIPQETYSTEDAVLLVASDELTHSCWLGLMMARQRYLNAPNRDNKRSVSSAALQNILWLVIGAPYPKSRWADIDMERFREIQKIRGGKNRAVAFFSENLGLPIHSVVIQSLLLQHDYMKRIRANGGARDVLRTKGIALLSRSYDRKTIEALSLPIFDKEHVIAIKPANDAERRLLRTAGCID
jgi:hypothetical protein